MRKIFLLFLIFSPLAFSQFSTINKFPFTDENYEGNAKIIDLGENHLICFFGEESIFYSHSFDDGATWNGPFELSEGKFFDALFYDNKIYVTGYSNNLFITSDSANTWEGPYALPLNSSSRIFIKHSDKFYVFYPTHSITFYPSADAITWEYGRTAPLPWFYACSFVRFDENNYSVALSVYDSESETRKIKIYSSNSLEENWTEIATIYTAAPNEMIDELRAARTGDGKYWIAFTKTDMNLERQKDIFYMTSEDGITWSDAELFARSYKNDIINNLAESPDFPIATLISNRENTWNLYYGKLSRSQDIFFPPFLDIVKKDLSINYNTEHINAKFAVKSFTWNNVLSVKVTYNGSTLGYLYDDGMHNDGLDGDSIFGNNFSFQFDYNAQISIVAHDVVSNETEEPIYNATEFAEEFSDNYCRINNGNVSFVFDNKGVVADVSGTNKRGIFYNDYSVVYSGGFVLSGYSNENLWANAVATCERIEDYVPGNVGSEEGKIYYVKSSDPAFGESWQAWAEAVEHGAKFYDGNGDGVYNPVDLNGNGVWDENEDAPEINGSVTAWCVYNDGLPSNDRYYNSVEPQGIEIRQTVWTNKYSPELKNVFFVRYSIFNTGTVTESLDSVYFSVWSDDDDGYYTNDLVGSSPNLLTGYTYDAGTDKLFGKNAPAVMKTLLYAEKLPANNLPNIEEMNGSFVHYMCIHPMQFCGLYSIEVARNYSLGLNPIGEPINPCSWDFGIVLNEDCSTIDGRWMYSGNPADSIGWINVFPTDQRSMLNIGPFDIASGESVEITVAYHFERGETNLQSVALGLDKAQYLRDNALVLDADETLKEVPNKFALYQNYPNPFNPVTTIKYSIPANASVETHDRVSLRIYNVLGEEIATLVNKRQAPGIYTVQFDASGLPSGIYFYTLKAGNFVRTKKMLLIK